MIALLAAIVEVLSLATLYPIILIGAKGVPATGMIVDIPQGIGIETARGIGIFWASCTLFASVVGLVTRSFATWFQIQFAENIRQTLSTRLFQSYIMRPYSFFLERNTTDLAKNILSEVDVVVSLAVTGWFQCVTAVATLVAVTCLLLSLSPVGTAFIIGLGGSLYLAIFYVSSKIARRLGKHRFGANERRHKIILESLSLIREVKTRNIENRQVTRYATQAKIVSGSFAKLGLIGNLPRYIIEALLFGGIAVTMLVLFIFDSGVEASFSTMLPTLSIMVASGIRVLPAAQSIYRGLNNARQAIPSIETMSKELANGLDGLSPDQRVRRKLENAIVLSDASFTHHGRNEPSLYNLNLTIEKGTVVGLSGQTGSGKSTLINLLMGLLDFTRGQMLIDGKPLVGDDRRGWQLNIGYVPQEIILADDTVERNIAFGFADDEIDIDRVHAAAKLACVDDVIARLPDGYQTGVGQGGNNLSGGQRQRICIARALYTDPDVIIFDEATSALDIPTERALLSQLQSATVGKTVIMVSHREETLDACDSVLRLSDGKLTI